MRIWVDLANSPHVAVMEPVVSRLEADGHEVAITARDHAQTVELARERWPSVVVIGDGSPPGRVGKGLDVLRRADQLRRFALGQRPDVAFSHGSYAQIIAARAAGIRVTTMMDYEHQPANHLSFRLAQRVVVPKMFPPSALRRFGARPEKVIRYPGFKEELYLAGVAPQVAVLRQLGLDDEGVIAVFRPPPEKALYHRMGNDRFEDVLRLALSDDNVRIVLLPRTAEQRARYEAVSPRIRVPAQAVDGRALLAAADLTIGAGGTMNRESALLGTPTYTVFAGELAAVDAELIRLGRLHDLRVAGRQPRFEKKKRNPGRQGTNADEILATILVAVGTLDRRRVPRDQPSS